MRNLIAINTPIYTNFFPMEDYSTIWDGCFDEIDCQEPSLEEVMLAWEAEHKEELKAEWKLEIEQLSLALKEHGQMLADYHREQFSDEEWAEITRRD